MSDYDERGMHVTDEPGRPTMRTWTGRHVDPRRVQANDVDIDDIAHALARQCRYNGHCDGWLSVARHSVDVSNRLEYRHPLDYDLQLWGLLHDAAETWVGDMIRPLKYSGAFDEYFRAEAVAERAVALAFGLSYPIPAAVKEADHASCLDELQSSWSHRSDFERDEIRFHKRFEDLQARRRAAQH